MNSPKNWQEHAEFFFKIRHFLPTDSLICIYNSLFVSFLQYGIIVWSQTFASYVDPIFKLQKRAVRAISHEKAFSHSTPIFGSLKLLSLHDIFKLRLLTFIFESINKLTPSCFNNFFTLNISVHHYETRQSFRGDIYLNKKIRFNLASSPFDIWEQNSGMTYQLKSETLPLDFYSKRI